MSCKVNFHVVRSALQCSMCLNGTRVFRPFQRKTSGSYGTSEKIVHGSFTSLCLKIVVLCFHLQYFPSLFGQPLISLMSPTTVPTTMQGKYVSART